MCRLYLRVLLLVMGCAMVFASVFPILAFLHLGEPLQTTFMASKLLMLPLGALCLIAAERLHASHR
jgi:hypothetical protein